MTQTGILDITAAEYFAIPALSNSGMKDLAISPLRFWHRHINPKRPQDEDESAALRIGSALHCAALEGADEFYKRYARGFDDSVYDKTLDTVADLREFITAAGGKPKGNAKVPLCEQALEMMDSGAERIPIMYYEKKLHASAVEGKTILSPEEWKRVDAMAVAIRNEPAINSILEKGKPEVAMVAKDPDTGVLLKCKLDWMAPRHTLDLKSFAQKRGASIDKSVADAIYYEHYHWQAFLYEHIRFLVTQERTPFVLGFVESDEPHETRIKVLTARSQYDSNMYWERARIEVKAMIRMYADCMDKFGDRPWRYQQAAEPLIDEDIRQLAY